MELSHAFSGEVQTNKLICLVQILFYAIVCLVVLIIASLMGQLMWHYLRI